MLSSCTLNPYCELVTSEGQQICQNKTLNQDCENIIDNGEVKKLFLYPEMLEEVKQL